MRFQPHTSNPPIESHLLLMKWGLLDTVKNTRDSRRICVTASRVPVRRPGIRLQRWRQPFDCSYT